MFQILLLCNHSMTGSKGRLQQHWETERRNISVAGAFLGAVNLNCYGWLENAIYIHQYESFRKQEAQAASPIRPVIWNI